jgi:hypothetical protein
MLTGWIEAFSGLTEKARQVIKGLLKESIPRFGLPWPIQIENGPILFQR